MRGVTETGFVVECLTIDHCCEQEEERGRVMAITTDPAPFRPSRGDVETFGQKSAPMRYLNCAKHDWFNSSGGWLAGWQALFLLPAL